MSVDIVVCNLTRFGDLLQSQALIDDLYLSGHRVGIVCLDNFAAALPLLRHVEMAWPFPGARLMASLDRNWPAAAGSLLNFANRIAGQGAPKFVLNLTPSLPARLLSRLLAGAGAKILGFGLDAHGFGINHGVWASFLAVAARQRNNSPFNVADLFRKLASPISRMAGSSRLAAPEAAAAAWADAFIASGQPATAGQAKGFVAFQLGASENRRRWPISHFRSLGQRLWQEAALCPILLGSASEIPLALKYASAAGHPFINAAGATDIPRLAALLKKSRLLVTNDTGTMHLAAGLAVPSLSFFLATAQPWDTGPLAPGSCCLEPALQCHPCAFGVTCPSGEKCRRLISAASAGDLILGWLRHGDWRQGMGRRAGKEATAWIVAADEAGFTRINPVFLDSVDGRDAWLFHLRHFWRQLLDDLDGQNSVAMAESVNNHWPQVPEPASAEFLDMAKSALPGLSKGAAILDSLSELGKMAVKSKQAGKLFLLNCERLQTILDDCQALATLAAFWREFRQAQGADLELFLPATARLASHFRLFAAELGRNMA